MLLRAFATEFDVETDEATEETVLASHSYNGQKRRMSIIEGTSAGIMDTQDLPAAPKVLPFDEQWVQDQVAEELHLSLDIQPPAVLPASSTHCPR